MFPLFSWIEHRREHVQQPINTSHGISSLLQSPSISTSAVGAIQLQLLTFPTIDLSQLSEAGALAADDPAPSVIAPAAATLATAP